MTEGLQTLRVVTSNNGKAREFAEALIGLPFIVERVDLSYKEVQADTLDEVAMASAQAILALDEVEPPFMLEDAGLFVDALEGFPGVYSAYVFQTVGCQGILRLLEGHEDRGATFESRIALCMDKSEVELVDGTCTGTISTATRGIGGFGFDPIFIPDGMELTFAEMDLPEKQAVSHRGRAMDALRERLMQL
jgi:XTP/dITP diphosphohydrolase